MMHHHAIFAPEMCPPPCPISFLARRPMTKAASDPNPPTHERESANPKPSIRLTRIWRKSAGSIRASSAKSESLRLLISDLDIHAQERRRKGLALRVGHQ